MLEDFLSKLGASTRITIGVSVSPSVGLEMIEVDRLTGTVSKYSNRPLEYNHSTREIADYEQFRSALEELFQELNVTTKSNIILSLPSVHFGIITLPILLMDDSITNAIISEAEQSYIFKRQEPAISWADIYSTVESENRTLAYSAIQQEALDKITEICDDLGCKIVGVENSYASLLKALHYTEAAKEQMQEKNTWNLMIIGQNSYSIISMFEKRIMEYYEEPLALKSFVDDEIYNAITISAQLTLSNLPANHLFIVSETDMVSAEVLAMKIQVESAVKFLECNKFTQNELLPANLNILPKKALQITPEAIGVAVTQFSDYPLKLNAIQGAEGAIEGVSEIKEIPKINIGNLEIELTPNFIKMVSIIIGAIVLIPMIIITLVLAKGIIPQEQAKLDALNSKIQEINAEITKYTQDDKSNAFDLKTTTDNIMANNKIKLSYYSALGMSIPNKLWVTYYTLNGAGKVDIKGKASDVKSVYTFYKGIKQLINNSDIRLYKLEIDSSSLDDIVSGVSEVKTYLFEITNMTDAELDPKAAAAAAAADANKPQTPDASQQQPPGQNNQPGPQLGKPLFGSKDTNTAQPNPQMSTASPVPPSPGDGQKLPNNLQKIEKF